MYTLVIGQICKKNSLYNITFFITFLSKRNNPTKPYKNETLFIRRCCG